MKLRLTTLSTRGLLLVLIMTKWLGSSAAEEPKNQTRSDPQAHQRVVLSHEELVESSGLAASNLRSGLFWSHNDSGGKPQLFAFDQSGKPTGRCRLSGAKAIDWEDMASFVIDGQARLIVADCGDNDARRKSISLYLLDEPDPHATSEVSTYQQLVVTYPDGSHNCEAIAVDSQRMQIILISKTSLSAAGVYTIPLSVVGEENRKTSVTATRVAGLPLPMISAMDLHPASGDVWVINYFQAFHFACADRGQPLGRQLAVLPKAFELPRWRQIEALAVDRDHQVWVTSEGSPARLGRLHVDVGR